MMNRFSFPRMLAVLLVLPVFAHAEISDYEIFDGIGPGPNLIVADSAPHPDGGVDWAGIFDDATVRYRRSYPDGTFGDWELVMNEIGAPVFDLVNGGPKISFQRSPIHGGPSITFRRNSSNTLVRCFQTISGFWTVDELDIGEPGNDPATMTGQSSCIRFLPSGTPVVLYQKAGRVRIWTRINDVFQSQDLFPGATDHLGNQVTFEIRPNGSLVVATYNTTNSTLFVAGMASPFPTSSTPANINRPLYSCISDTGVVWFAYTGPEFKGDFPAKLLKSAQGNIDGSYDLSRGMDLTNNKVTGLAASENGEIFALYRGVRPSGGPPILGDRSSVLARILTFSDPPSITYTQPLLAPDLGDATLAVSKPFGSVEFLGIPAGNPDATIFYRDSRLRDVDRDGVPFVIEEGLLTKDFLPSSDVDGASRPYIKFENREVNEVLRTEMTLWRPVSAIQLTPWIYQMADVYYFLEESADLQDWSLASIPFESAGDVWNVHVRKYSAPKTELGDKKFYRVRASRHLDGIELPPT